MRKYAPVALALAIPLLATLPPAAQATTLVVAHTPAVASTAASPAIDAASGAKSLRRDVSTMLQRYIDDYGNRFTAAERGQLLSYRGEADRQLAALVVTTQRLAQASAPTVSTAQRKAAGRAAQSAWQRAKTKAETTFESARQIMEPKLSMWEKLSAMHDYDTMMRRFDELGVQIDEAARG